VFRLDISTVRSRAELLGFLAVVHERCHLCCRYRQSNDSEVFLLAAVEDSHLEGSQPMVSPPPAGEVGEEEDEGDARADDRRDSTRLLPVSSHAIRTLALRYACPAPGIDSYVVSASFAFDVLFQIETFTWLPPAVVTIEYAEAPCAM
jgi:hypothetical protein